ncbi:hypothetical protein V2E24_00010 [Mycoplasmopsis ciconiae]|uniref:ECM-binding protein homolog n=1 Tax=Mycoplasmopsis ciconiae TaxID=561067 RepID=A0ABU7MKB8_9BACT|nr:hypothetical protein [Mycoplasmopsis ciconiae]
MKKNKKIILTGVIAGTGLTAITPLTLSAELENSDTTESNSTNNDLKARFQNLYYQNLEMQDILNEINSKSYPLNSEQLQKLKELKQQSDDLLVNPKATLIQSIQLFETIEQLMVKIRVKMIIYQNTWNQYEGGLNQAQVNSYISQLDEKQDNDFQSIYQLRDQILQMVLQVKDAFNLVTIYTFGGPHFNEIFSGNSFNDTIQDSFNTYRIFEYPNWESDQEYAQALNTYKNQSQAAWNSLKNPETNFTLQNLLDIVNQSRSAILNFGTSLASLSSSNPDNQNIQTINTFVNKNDGRGSFVYGLLSVTTQQNSNAPLNGDLQGRNSIGWISGFTFTRGVIANLFIAIGNSNYANIGNITTQGYRVYAFGSDTPFRIKGASALLHTNATTAQNYAILYNNFYNTNVNQLNSSPDVLYEFKQKYTQAKDIIDKINSKKFFIENFNFKQEWYPLSIFFWQDGTANNAPSSATYNGQRFENVIPYKTLEISKANTLNNLINDLAQIEAQANVTPTADNWRKGLTILNGFSKLEEQKSKLEEQKTQIDQIIANNQNNPQMVEEYTKILNKINENIQNISSLNVYSPYSPNDVTLPQLELNNYVNANLITNEQQVKQALELQQTISNPSNQGYAGLTQEQITQIPLIKQKVLSGEQLSEDDKNILTVSENNVREYNEIQNANTQIQTQIDDINSKLEGYKNLLSASEYSELESALQSARDGLTNNTFSPSTSADNNQENNQAKIDNLNQILANIQAAAQKAEHQNQVAEEQLNEYKSQANNKIADLIQNVKNNPNSLLTEEQKSEIIRNLENQKDSLESALTLQNAKDSFNTAITEANKSIANNTIDNLIQKVQDNEDNNFQEDQIQDLVSRLQQEKQKALDAISSNSQDQQPQENSLTSTINSIVNEANSMVSAVENKNNVNKVNDIIESLNLNEGDLNSVLTTQQQQDLQDIQEKIKRGENLSPDDENKLEVISNNINQYAQIKSLKDFMQSAIDKQNDLNPQYNSYLSEEQQQKLTTAIENASNTLQSSNFAIDSKNENNALIQELQQAKEQLNTALEEAKQQYQDSSNSYKQEAINQLQENLPQAVKNNLISQIDSAAFKNDVDQIKSLANELNQKQSSLNEAIEHGKTIYGTIRESLGDEESQKLQQYLDNLKQDVNNFSGEAQDYKQFLDDKTAELNKKISVAQSLAKYNDAQKAINDLNESQIPQSEINKAISEEQKQQLQQIKNELDEGNPISPSQDSLLTTLQHNAQDLKDVYKVAQKLQSRINNQDPLVAKYSPYLTEEELRNLNQAFENAKQVKNENQYVAGDTPENLGRIENLNNALTQLNEAIKTASDIYVRKSGDLKQDTLEVISSSNLPESVKQDLTAQAQNADKNKLESIQSQVDQLTQTQNQTRDQLQNTKDQYQGIVDQLTEVQQQSFNSQISEIETKLNDFNGDAQKYQELLSESQNNLLKTLKLAKATAQNNNVNKAIEQLNNLNLPQEQLDKVLTPAQKEQLSQIQQKLEAGQTLEAEETKLLEDIPNNIEQFSNINTLAKNISNAISEQEKLSDEYNKYLNSDQQQALNDALSAAQQAVSQNVFTNNDTDHNTEAKEALEVAKTNLEKALQAARDIYNSKNQEQKASVRDSINANLPESVKQDLNTQIDQANTKDKLDAISDLNQFLASEQSTLNNSLETAAQEFEQIKNSLTDEQQQQFNSLINQTKDQLNNFDQGAEAYKQLLETKAAELAKQLSLTKSNAQANDVAKAIESLNDLGIPQEEISKVITPEQQQKLEQIKQKLNEGTILSDEDNQLLQTIKNNVEEFKNIDTPTHQINDAVSEQEKLNEEYAKYLTPEQMQELNEALEAAKMAVQDNTFENANSTHNTEAANNLNAAQEALNQAINKAREIFESQNKNQKDDAKDTISKDIPEALQKALEDLINNAKTKEEIEAIKQLAQQINESLQTAKEQVENALSDYANIQNNLSIAQNAQIQQQINNAKNAINNYEGTPQDYPKFIEDTLKELNKNIEVAKINAQINEQKELAQNQVEAKEKIDQAIENTNNNDQLTPAQKQEIINNLTQAKDEIDSAQNADEINKAVEQALAKQNKDTAKAQVDNLIDKVNNNPNLSQEQKQNIVSDLQKQKDLIDNSEQSQIPSILDKAKVIENVDTQKALVDNEINNVQNNDLLTPAQKQELVNNLNTAKDQLQQALNSNQNPSADLAQNALDSTQTKVDEFKDTNKELNNTKVDAKDQLNNLINSIQNNEELTPTQKAEIINKVNEALNNINNASEIPNVEQIAAEARNEANKALEADKSQNTELNTAKNSAKEEIQQLINNIQTNEQLTPAQKQELANKLQEQINNLNNAENNTDVQNTLQQAKNLASEESQANIKLNNDKNQAQQQVNQLIESVQNNPNLSESQKHEIINELNNTKVQIENAKDSDSINSSVEKAKAVENIETQKALVDNEIDKIQNNDLLTPAQKQELINALNNTKDKLDQALENNTSVEDNLTAQSLESAENKVQEFKETNKELNENKANAKDQLNNLINSIQNNEELTPTQKADIINKIKEAINDINNSADIQNVAQITKDAAQSANNSVQNDKETNIPLNNAKEEAKAEIDKLLEQINNNPNLSEQQKQNLSTQAQQIKDTLNNQEIIPDVNRVVQEAKENLAKAQESDQALNSAREKFLDALDNINQSINQQNDLTPNQKQSLNEVVNTEKAKVDQINNFSDVDVVVEAIKAKITSLIAQEIVKNRELNIEKANVDNKIEDIIKSISDNKYLNETQKQEIINNIKQKQQQAHESNTSEQLQQQLQNIYNYVNSNEVKGLEVNNAKDKLVNEINDLIEKEIKQNPNLSEEQKQQLEKQVNDLINQNIKDANSLSSLKEIQNKLEQEISQLLPQKSQTNSPAKVALIVGISIIAIALSLGTYGIYLLAKKRRK